MTEAYTKGGDALANLGNDNFTGQTFTPTKTHVLKWVDIELKDEWGKRLLSIWVKRAGHDHRPYGAIISRSIRSATKLPFPGTLHRHRYLMSPATLEAGEYYAVYAHAYATPQPWSMRWQYDSTDPEYYRGIRIWSGNGGASWAVRLEEDMIFAEFGDPPAPPVEADPPIPYFHPTEEGIGEFPGGACVGLATNSPAHLTLYWTATKPRKHPTSRTVRGITMPWYSYFCFVAWHEVEQVEPGDTLYHSFPLCGWGVGSTRYFVARGEIDGNLAPSVTPVFSHTRVGHSPNSLILRPVAQGDACEIRAGTPYACPYHFYNVDEVIPDEDTSMIWSGNFPETGQFLDLYYPTRPLCGCGDLEKITLHYRCRGHGRYPFTGRGRPAVKVGGVVYYGSQWSEGTDTWRDFEHTWVNNPNTGLPWTWADLATFQIGMSLFGNWTSGYHAHSYMTQLYAEIFY